MKIYRKRNYNKHPKSPNQLLKRISDRHFKTAYKYDQQREIGLAIKFYTKSIYFYSKNASAFYNRGLAFHQNCKYDEAIDNYDKAISLSPNYINAYCNRATVFARKGEVEKAKRDYLKALSIKPNAVAYCGLGVYAYDKKDFDSAIEYFKQAGALDQQKGAYFQNLGNAYLQAGDYQKAIAAYTKSIGMKESSKFILVSYKGRCLAYQKAGKSLLAAEDAKRYNEMYKQLEAEVRRTNERKSLLQKINPSTR